MEVLSHIPLIGGLLTWVLPILIVLTVVVFVHEFGHYIVGRWCGIHAEVFSIGFGTPLFKRKDKRGTVWQVAAIPLGGYVRFTGDMDPASAGRVKDDDLTPEESRSAFHNATLLRRTLTVSAGPVANFILSIVLFAAIALWTGQPSNDPVLGEVGQFAAQSGLQTGDRIVSADGKPIDTYSGFFEVLNKSEGSPVNVVVQRDGKDLHLTLANYQMARIVQVNPGMPAADSGMRAGDVVVAVNGTPLHKVSTLQKLTIATPKGQSVAVELRRGTKDFTVHLTPVMMDRKNPETGKMEELPTMGIVLSRFAQISPKMIPVPPLDAVRFGALRTWSIISETVTYIGRMLFEGADHSQLGGPIRIAKMSVQVAQQGTSTLVMWIGLLSTSIGLINLFPIPVLDGGHLMFYALEALRGRPVGATAMRYGTMVGLSLVLLLLVFVTYNDLRWLQ